MLDRIFNVRVLLAAVVAVSVATPGWASPPDELDQSGAGAPVYILKKLDPVSKSISSYRVDKVDSEVLPDSLGKVPEKERKGIVETFLRSAEKPENLIGTELAQLVRSTHELDQSSSTSACYYGWQGCSSGAYFGWYFEFTFSGMPCSYQPYWGYGGYFSGGYAPLYGGMGNYGDGNPYNNPPYSAGYPDRNGDGYADGPGYGGGYGDRNGDGYPDGPGYGGGYGDRNGDGYPDGPSYGGGPGQGNGMRPTPQGNGNGPAYPNRGGQPSYALYGR